MYAVHVLLGIAAALPLATHDNNVEWDGISHIDSLDRRPICPVDGESFTVYFQTFDFDITSARVHYDDGTPQWITATYSHDHGAYDVWKAQLPCTDIDAVVEYYIEVTDGAETDYLGPGGMSATTPASGWIIDYDTLLHAPLGSTPTSDGGVVFKVWGAGASTASVAGEFNGWNSSANPMSKDGVYFTARVDGVFVGQKYKYVFDGNTWKPDARARRVDPGNNYNSYVEDPTAYVWESSADFDIPDFEEMIIYQLHVGTYAGRNDGNNFGTGPATYRSIVDSHLGHLADLGINVVQLMPITEFPTDWSGGYNPVTQWQVEWGSGSPDDFKYMVDKFHGAGIAVTIDLVWNHFSGSDNYLWNYTADGGGVSTQIYFDGNGTTGHEDTPWGAQADFDRSEVRDYFADSALYWLEEFRLDGFRMDGVDFMNPYQGSGWGLMQRMNNEMDNRAVDKIALAEQLPDDHWVTKPTSQGGAGFDSQYHDRHKYSMRSAIFAAASGTGSADITELRRTIVGDMNDGSNILGVGQSTTKLVRYFELHDEAWPENGGQRMVKSIDTTSPHDDVWARGRTLYGLALNMFSPGIPAMFMGSEFLEDTDFESNDSHRIDWSKAATYANYLQAVKDMIRIRKQNPGFRANADFEINRTDESKDTLTMHRWDGAGNDLLVVASLANEDQLNYHLGFPQGGIWHEIYNSQASSYGGNGSGNGGAITANGPAKDGYLQSAWITIPRMSVTVFRAETCTSDGQCGDGVACTDDACVQGMCRNSANDTLCPDDGAYCNGAEICNQWAGCVSEGDPCGAGAICNETTDACEADALARFPAFADCLAGPGITPQPAQSFMCSAACLTQFDYDTDGDVDLVDFSKYQFSYNLQIETFSNNVAGWQGAFAGSDAHAFDSHYPGLFRGTGPLTGASAMLNLGGVNLTVTDLSGVGALWDENSRPQVSDGHIANGNVLRWEFDQSIYGLYTFFASLPSGNMGTMTLYSGGTEVATLNRNSNGSLTAGYGLGFASTTGIDRIDFAFQGPDSLVLVGAGSGVDPGESNLGTIEIPGYSGPNGTTVELDFAIATTPPTP